MNTEELVKALLRHTVGICGEELEPSEKPLGISCETVRLSASTIVRQAEAIRVLREALSDLHEFAEAEHVKPYNGGDAVCHHPKCGEDDGHLPWCPIGMAEKALAQTQEFAE